VRKVTAPTRHLVRPRGAERIRTAESLRTTPVMQGSSGGEETNVSPVTEGTTDGVVHSVIPVTQSATPPVDGSVTSPKRVYRRKQNPVTVTHADGTVEVVTDWHNSTPERRKAEDKRKRKRRQKWIANEKRKRREGRRRLHS
jgi:hypothetical protein